MMQSMSVKPEQVVALSGQIRNGAKGIADELSRLESEVGKLRASWDGSAQLAYDDAQRKWHAALGELQQLLEQIASKTQAISEQYVSSDRSSASRFGA